MLTKSFQLGEDFPDIGPEAWREMVEGELAGASFEKKLMTRLYEGIALQPLYTEVDWPWEGDPRGMPGGGDFVRGAEALRQGWRICQAASHPDPEAANGEILAGLNGGVEGVWLRMARWEPASEPDGLVARNLDDLAAALAGVDASATPVTLDAGAAWLPAAAMLAALWRRNGVDWEGVSGSLGADPLGALAAEGRVHGSPEPAMTRLGALADWADRNLPRMTTAVVSTTPYHDAGATAVQDLAMAMATGVAYLRAMTAAGMPIEAACGQITFRMSAGTHFFKTVAKLRAARRLWARVTEACGAGGPTCAMRMHLTTARRCLTQRDPWVNILRATVGCFAGAVAGAEAITVEPLDARLGAPGELSRRVARNTQTILAEESNLGRVMDPAGGCWFVEKLTDQLATEAWRMFQTIEGRGGALAVLTDGWIGGEIEAVWNERLKALAKRKDSVTGVSEFPNLNEKLPRTAAVDWAAVRARGNASDTGESVAVKAMLGHAAQSSGVEQFESLIAAAEAGALATAMVEALGGLKEVSAPLPFRPLAGPFEALRDASDLHLAKTGARPRAFLANLGPVAQHTARATWSRNFLEAGGFETIGGKGSADAAEAASEWKSSGAATAVICSSDKIYGERAADAARALKAAGARTVVLAGSPGENRDAWSAAGVDLYIHMGCDAHGILTALMQQEGVLA
jgi:methylmalonyl-CoA mutase